LQERHEIGCPQCRGRNRGSAWLIQPHAEPYRLIQVSDCHLPENPEQPYRGVNADSGLGSLLGPISQWRPQGILLTGDLSEDASPASYQRLLKALGRLNVPIFALPGNHDEDAVMRQFFPQGPWAGPLQLSAGDWQLVLIKSSREKRIDGVVSPADLEALDTLLREDARPALIALHHQPVAIGSPWIDRYMLEQPGPLLQRLESCRQVRGVVWGHVHQVFEGVLGQAHMLSCPSTAANSLSGTERFQPDPAGPACRWLKLHPQGRLESGVLRAA
jgi:Icc protein